MINVKLFTHVFINKLLLTSLTTVLEYPGNWENKPDGLLNTHLESRIKLTVEFANLQNLMMKKSLDHSLEMFTWLCVWKGNICGQCIMPAN